MDSIYKQVQRLENDFKNRLDQPSHDRAQAIRQEIQRLMDDIELKKNPRSIEDRVKNLKRQLQELGYETLVMDYHHSEELKDQCDDIIQALRKV